MTAIQKKQVFTRLEDLNHYNESTELIDLEMFGALPKSNKIEFRWGTLEQLINLEREDKPNPLKLKKILHRKADNSLGGLKLVFEGDIETDAMDCEYDKKEFTTYDLKEQRLKSIKMRVNPCNSGCYINTMSVIYEDGSEDSLFSYNSNGNFVTRDIPAGCEISGIYAYTAKPNEYIRMHAVGFTVERMKK